ncbi:MAG: hypothetical protein KDC68_01905 [Gelidibacter sp.]|nr:hypothetical protein [Gelidibacter sp.]
MKEILDSIWELCKAPFVSVGLAYSKFPQLLLALVSWAFFLFGSFYLFNIRFEDEGMDIIAFLLEGLLFGGIFIFSFHFSAVMLVQMIRNIELEGQPKAIKSMFAVFYGRSLLMLPILFVWISLYTVLGILMILIALITGRTKSSSKAGDFVMSAFMFVFFFFSYLYVFLLAPVIFNGFNLKKSFKEVKVLIQHDFLRLKGGLVLLTAAFLLLGIGIMRLNEAFFQDNRAIYVVLLLLMLYFHSLLLFVSEAYLSALKYMRLQAENENGVDWTELQRPLIGDNNKDLESSQT